MSTLPTRNPRFGLFPELVTHDPTFTTGVLPAQNIQELIDGRRIVADDLIQDEQIQPASIDLRLGPVAYQVRASFLPGRSSTVMDRIGALQMAKIDISKPALLGKGCIYIVPLVERLDLPQDMSARANPKSTTGRLDIFTRLITDYGVEFEQVPSGYTGPLYAEIVSRTFPVFLGAGTKLNQLRFIRGKPSTSDNMMTALDEEEVLVYAEEDNPAKAQIDKGLRISMSLQGEANSDIVAYKAKRIHQRSNQSKVDFYPIEEFSGCSARAQKQSYHPRSR